jgi:hypothetical protein
MSERHGAQGPIDDELIKHLRRGGRYPAEPLLRPSDVAALFHVAPRTVTRWARAGELTTIFTLGGHRRYQLAEVLALRARRIEQRTARECDARRR